MKTPPKVVVDMIRKCLTKTLTEERWLWTVMVWKKQGSHFSDFRINSTFDFPTKEKATEDMDKAIALLNIESQRKMKIT